MSQAKTVISQHDMDDCSKAAFEDVSHLLVHSLIRVSAIRLLISYVLRVPIFMPVSFWPRVWTRL